MADEKKKTEALETPAAEGAPRRKKINEMSPAEMSHRPGPGRNRGLAFPVREAASRPEKGLGVK
jgi:hypothetical protein